MTAFQLALRILIGLVEQPAVRDALTKAGRAITRQATAALIRAVQNGTRTRKSPQTLQ